MRSRTPAIDDEVVLSPRHAAVPNVETGELDKREICREVRFSAVRCPSRSGNAGITEYQLELLQHIGGKIFRDGHSIHACPIVAIDSWFAKVGIVELHLSCRWT